MLSLQDEFAPNSICFGCGPKNVNGLKVKSFVKDEGVICDWKSAPHHEAFPGILNGGIIGAIMDCHSNWTAAWYLMKKADSKSPSCTVTSSFSVKLLCPTPSNDEVRLVAKLIELKPDRATIETSLFSKGKITATCNGIFVQVKPGHPAYHRW